MCDRRLHRLSGKRADGSGQPDIVKAYYRNDKDKNGNPVEQYSLAMQVQETDYEHANGMAYNPNTNEIAVSLYTSYQKENRGCLLSWMQIH